jgi:alpha-beta hydrolase superfamily lysophospholipase
MTEWWHKYNNKFPGAGIFFPEEDWMSLKSVNGYKLMTYRFHNENPRALIFSFHGMYSESNESAHLCKHLFENGFTVLSFDQEGHGKSKGTKGKIKSLQNYLQDSIKFLKKSIRRYPKVPVYIFGLSMGGTICTMLSLKVPELISGMVLFAPGLGVAPDFEPLLRKLVRCLNLCCGCLKLKEFDGTLSNRNKDYIEYFRENPFNYSGRMDVGTAYSMLTGLEGLQDVCSNVDVPFVLVQGTDDKIVDFDMARRFYDECKSRDKEFWTYEGMYHDVYHEPEIDEILERVTMWFNKRVERDGFN